VALALSLIVTTPAIADDPPIDVPISEIGKQFRLIGELGWPIDQIITVQGDVAEDPSKGADGPLLCPRIIMGAATQENIRVPMDGPKVDHLRIGGAYELRGYERITYSGIQPELMERYRGVQTRGRYLRNDFVIIDAVPIDPITLHPGQFENRDALFQGIATNSDGRSLMVADKWAVVVSSDVAWPDEVVDKQVETFGQYSLLGTSRTGRDIYELTSGTWRLVELADQTGQQVALRGLPRRWNGEWLFVYRGALLRVDGLNQLPGWESKLSGEAILLRGVLEELPTPQADSTGLMEINYRIRELSWEATDPLLAPERKPLE
jgi:hypothetical protein